MTRDILLDLCLDQDRRLDDYLRTPPSSDEHDWLDQAVIVYAIHADSLVRAYRRYLGRRRSEPGGDGTALLTGVVRNAVTHGRAILSAAQHQHVPPEQAEEITGTIRRLDDLLATQASPPDTGIPTRDQAVEMFRSGQALELDAAFARIAGVSVDEWGARVAGHRSPPAPPSRG